MNAYRNPRRSRARRGIATLEFAMCLPVLLVLFVTIVWLGASLVSQTEVTVLARNKTWTQRFQATPGSGDPLIFKADAPIKRDAETTVEISPIFAGAAPPKANHAVLGGSWDYRQLDLNRPPNWNLYAKVGGSTANNAIQNLLGNLNNLSQFGDQASGVLGGVAPAADGGQDLNSFGDLGSFLPQ